MFCPNCGNEIKPGAKFCNGCGQPVGVKNEEDNNPKVIVVKEQPEKRTAKKRYTGFIVLLIVLGIVFVGLVVAYFVIDDTQTPNDNNTETPNNEVVDLSDENKLVKGYWLSDYFGDVMFRPIESNSDFDGIVVMAYEGEVFPYKIDENGKIVVYVYGHVEENLGYHIFFEINAIETNEDGNNCFTTTILVNGEDTVFANVDADEDYMLLRFDVWTDYDYDVKLANEMNDHLFKHSITESAQRDVKFYDFSYYGDFSEDYNLHISTDEYGGEDYFNAEESYNEIFEIISEDNCVYIGKDKYQFSKDCSKLYCEETGHTIYRITDFAFGKIADTDFSPGNFIYVR